MQAQVVVGIENDFLDGKVEFVAGYSMVVESVGLAFENELSRQDFVLDLFIHRELFFQLLIC